MSSVFGPRLRGIESASWIDRRGFVIGAGVTGATLGTGLGVVYGQAQNGADRTLRIAPLKLELAPNKFIETFAYNAMVPGPLLRFREGQPVTIDVTNDTDIEDIVHWHGLYLPEPRGRGNGGRIANGHAGRHATLQIRGQAIWHAMVSQPQYRRHKPRAQSLWRDVRFLYHRTAR